MQAITRRLFTLLATLSVTSPPWAQSPSSPKPLTFIVGYPPGGTTDVLARLYAEHLGAKLGTSVIVVNRPGASSRIAVAEVKRAPADGSVFLFTNASPIVIFPHIYSDLAYEPMRDFAPVAIAARTDLVLSVGPGVPTSVKTLDDYVRWVKGHPDQASFGSVQGTSPHFAGQIFSSVAGLDLRLIPYKGGAAAVTDLLGGHVPAVVSSLGEALPFEKDGGLRMLAVLSSRRSGLAPQVPCMAELGYPGVDFPGWIGLLAPAATPPATVDRINAAFTDISARPAVVAQLRAIGLDPDVSTTAAFRALLATDSQNYRKAVALTGFKATE